MLIGTKGLLNICAGFYLRMGCGRGKEIHKEVVIGMREKKRKTETERKRKMETEREQIQPVQIIEGKKMKLL